MKVNKNLNVNGTIILVSDSDNFTRISLIDEDLHWLHVNDGIKCEILILLFTFKSLNDFARYQPIELAIFNLHHADELLLT